MYDVIVIGAGPTGCTAAHELVSHGYKVLLVERKSLPRNKSCSGILIKKSMDLVQTYYGESVPNHTTCTPVDNRGMVLVNDIGEEFRFEQPGKNIWRSTFDNWLATKAVEAGAELRTGTTAVKCMETADGIQVELKKTDTKESNYLEQAGLVICCTGATNALGHTHQNVQRPIFTYQTFCHGTIDLDPHFFYAYLQPELSQYDAWFNVKDDFLIFGVATKDAKKLQMYHERFLTYMNEHFHATISVQVRREKWIMPQIASGCPTDTGAGRILLAGESAGFLNPMGEGISNGLESGYYAAKSIIDTFKSHRYDKTQFEELHDRYHEYLRPLHSYMTRQWDFIGRLSGTFSHMRIDSIDTPKIAPEYSRYGNKQDKRP